jgi:hypothetical protein
MIDQNIRVCDLARLCDTSERYIYYILEGKRKAPIHRITISKALGISIDQFKQIIADSEDRSLKG